MEETHVNKLNSLVGAISGYLIAFLFKMLFVATGLSDTNLLIFITITNIMSYYLVYRGLRYGITGMFVSRYQVDSIPANTDFDYSAETLDHHISSPQGMHRSFFDTFEHELEYLHDKFNSCKDLIQEIQKYVKKNREKVENYIARENITLIQWLYISLKTLAANRIERGGFVYRGAPDIQGMDYLQVFDYATDKLAQLHYEEYTPEFAQREKEAFRDYLSKNFG
jgi:hypothetical protein